MRSTLLAVFVAAVVPADTGGPARDFTRGEYGAAAQAYEEQLERDPDSPVLHYNLGATLLRMRTYADARSHLEVAAETGDSTVSQAAFYNLGNADLQPAYADTLSDREALLRAIEAYKQALLLDPRDMDAKWNLELARHLLETREDPQSGGGGGGEGGGGGGGGGGDRQQQGSSAPSSRAPSDAATGEMSSAEADRLLSGAQQREVRLQRTKLRKAQPDTVQAH